MPVLVPKCGVRGCESWDERDVAFSKPSKDEPRWDLEVIRALGFGHAIRPWLIFTPQGFPKNWICKRSALPLVVVQHDWAYSISS